METPHPRADSGGSAFPGRGQRPRHLILYPLLRPQVLCPPQALPVPHPRGPQSVHGKL